MRLIDADALKDAIRAESWKEDTTVKMAVEYINILIDEQPTINPDDLRPQGRWIDIYRLAVKPEWICRCSLCGCPQDFKHHYCPHCGAMMDGKENEE